MPENGGSRSSISPAPFAPSPLASPTRAPFRPAPLPPTAKPKSPDVNLAYKADRTIIVSTGTLSGFTGKQESHIVFVPICNIFIADRPRRRTFHVWP